MVAAMPTPVIEARVVRVHQLNAQARQRRHVVVEDGRCIHLLCAAQVDDERHCADSGHHQVRPVEAFIADASARVSGARRGGEGRLRGRERGSAFQE